MEAEFITQNSSGDNESQSGRLKKGIETDLDSPAEEFPILYRLLTSEKPKISNNNNRNGMSSPFLSFSTSNRYRIPLVRNNNQRMTQAQAQALARKSGVTYEEADSSTSVTSSLTSVPAPLPLPPCPRGGGGGGGRSYRHYLRNCTKDTALEDDNIPTSTTSSFEDEEYLRRAKIRRWNKKRTVTSLTSPPALSTVAAKSPELPEPITLNSLLKDHPSLPELLGPPKKLRKINSPPPLLYPIGQFKTLSALSLSSNSMDLHNLRHNPPFTELRQVLSRKIFNGNFNEEEGEEEEGMEICLPNKSVQLEMEMEPKPKPSNFYLNLALTSNCCSSRTINSTRRKFDDLRTLRRITTATGTGNNNNNNNLIVKNNTFCGDNDKDNNIRIINEGGGGIELKIGESHPNGININKKEVKDVQIQSLTNKATDTDSPVFLSSSSSSSSVPPPPPPPVKPPLQSNSNSSKNSTLLFDFMTKTSPEDSSSSRPRREFGIGMENCSSSRLFSLLLDGKRGKEAASSGSSSSSSSQNQQGGQGQGHGSLSLNLKIKSQTSNVQIIGSRGLLAEEKNNFHSQQQHQQPNIVINKNIKKQYNFLSDLLSKGSSFSSSAAEDIEEKEAVVAATGKEEPEIENPKNEIEEEPFPCGKCSCTFHDIRLLIQHAKVHRNN